MDRCGEFGRFNRCSLSSAIFSAGLIDAVPGMGAVVADEARRNCWTAMIRLAGEMALALARAHEARPVARSRDCRAMATISTATLCYWSFVIE